LNEHASIAVGIRTEVAPIALSEGPSRLNWAGRSSILSQNISSTIEKESQVGQRYFTTNWSKSVPAFAEADANRVVTLASIGNGLSFSM
jgi:hypothetical protein